MKTAIAIFAAITFLSGAGAKAASLCNCCGEATASACAAACAPVKPAAGQCIAVLDRKGEAVIGPDQNPLYDIPLRNAQLDPADGELLEAFRLLLEKARKGAEADRKLALRAWKAGKINAATAQSRADRYDDALVNYYLGMQAYRLAAGSGQLALRPSR